VRGHSPTSSSRDSSATLASAPMPAAARVRACTTERSVSASDATVEHVRSAGVLDALMCGQEPFTKVAAAVSEVHRVTKGASIDGHASISRV
jgi:hypothetical protein